MLNKKTLITHWVSSLPFCDYIKQFKNSNILVIIICCR